MPSGTGENVVWELQVKAISMKKDELFMTNDEFCMKKLEFFMKKDELCMKKDELCMKKHEFCINNDCLNANVQVAINRAALSNDFTTGI